MAGEGPDPASLARAAWPRAVGRTIEPHTRILKMVRSTLIVETDDRVWRQQLFTLRHQILANLARILGPGLVQEIEFRVAGPERFGPQRAERSSPAASGDEADAIADAGMRRIYRVSKRSRLA